MLKEEEKKMEIGLDHDEALDIMVLIFQYFFRFKNVKTLTMKKQLKKYFFKT